MRAKTATSASSSTTRRSALRTSKTYEEQNRGRSRTKRSGKRSLEAELQEVVNKKPRSEKDGKDVKGAKVKQEDKGRKKEKAEKDDKDEKKEKGVKKEKAEKNDKDEKKEKGGKKDKHEKKDKDDKKEKGEKKEKAKKANKSKGEKTEKTGDAAPSKDNKDNKDKAGGNQKGSKDGKEVKAVKAEVKNGEKADVTVKREKVEEAKKRQRSVSAAESEKENGGKGGKKKDPPIVFKPAEKQKIQHIFTTPEAKTTRSPSPPPLSRLSSKEQAEKRFEELTKHLKDSDLEDDESSCPASDIERFMNGEEATPQNEEAESEDEEEEEPEEEDQENDEESDEEDADKEEEDESSQTSSENASEEEDEEQDESEKESEKGEKTDETEAPSHEHALVPVTNDSQEKAIVLRNSVTHKKEWDAFCRTAKGKMPAQLADMYLASKNELFNLWVDSGMDWSKCKMEVQRQQEAKNTGKRGWKAVQAKELKLQYSAEKFEKFKASRLASGLYYKDPDFPDDEDDSWLELNLFGRRTISAMNYQKCIVDF